MARFELQKLYIDGGYHIMGMAQYQASDV